MPATQNLVINAFEPEAIGKRPGTYNMVRQLGGVSARRIAVAFSHTEGREILQLRVAAAFQRLASWPALESPAALSVRGAFAWRLSARAGQCCPGAEARRALS